MAKKSWGIVLASASPRRRELLKQVGIEFQVIKSGDQKDAGGFHRPLTEEELALFDLLVNKPEIKLTNKERRAVKKTAHELLAKLKDSQLTLDWRKHQQAQAQVRITIEDILEELVGEIVVGANPFGLAYVP